MDHSPLNSLPTELRNQIYREALHITDYLRLDLFSSTREKLIYGEPQINLIRTCKQIRNESLPILYGCNRFVADLGDLTDTKRSNDIHSFGNEGPIPRFIDWLRTIGYENARCIREIDLRMGMYVLGPKSQSPDLAARALSPAVVFFAGTGAESLKVELSGEPPDWAPSMRLTLPLTDLGAARLQVYATCRSYLASRMQSQKGLDTLYWVPSETHWAQLISSFANMIDKFLERMQGSMAKASPRDGIFVEQTWEDSMKRSLVVALNMPLAPWSGCRARSGVLRLGSDCKAYPYVQRG